MCHTYIGFVGISGDRCNGNRRKSKTLFGLSNLESKKVSRTGFFIQKFKPFLKG